MKSKTALGLTAACALLVVLGFGIFATQWDVNDEPQAIPFDDEGVDYHTTLNYAVFEQYGPLLIVLGILMFGAMVGGICIAREEIEKDDDENQEAKE